MRVKPPGKAGWPEETPASQQPGLRFPGCPGKQSAGEQCVGARMALGLNGEQGFGCCGDSERAATQGTLPRRREVGGVLPLPARACLLVTGDLSQRLRLAYPAPGSRGRPETA